MDLNICILVISRYNICNLNICILVILGYNISNLNILRIHISYFHGHDSGVQGGHIRRRRPWSAMVVLVVVGRWRLTSDQPTVGIVKIVYGSIFLFLRRTHTFLISDPAAKKRDLGESELVV
jgi:hypothetical protein